ncbi:hypothetical protein SGO26_17900 [Cupriavidus metallidurans]|uniref:hypothetical protein n=1 Tax=Cupriavidus TaxID=106589 RepID=UPI000E9D5A31|nr:MULTISPECIES: hypothetical protein [unclassified Cupriavidus]GMG92765.1 hypothetical protein Cmtc_39850 [Cupriavidus sp. TKC]HBD35529.1 hypothetical protein [Cupriavidus sp.]HBO82697.1 hypothetical protein [Cupriavidus sp.]
MGISRWFRRRGTAASGGGARGGRDVDDTIERMTALNPRLRLATRYQQRLAPETAAALEYVRGLVAQLPAVHEACAADWSTDACIHACFATADDVSRAINGATTLRRFFDNNLAADEAYAVLGMTMVERHTLGVATEGDTVRSDVPQTTFSFSDHQLTMCEPTEAALREEIVRRMLDQLAVQGMARIASRLTKRDALKQEIALLKTRQRLLESQGKGMGAVVGGAVEPAIGEVAKLDAEIARNDAELAKLSEATGTLDRQLDILIKVIGDVRQLLRVDYRHVRLSRMNVLLTNDDVGGDDVELGSATIPGDPPLVRAFMLVRVKRSAIVPVRNMLDEAERFL